MNPARRLIFGSLAAMAVLVGLLFWRPGNSPAALPREPLLVYCAAGLKGPVEEASREYERRTGVPVQLQFGGSGLLLNNLKVARRGDLFLAADNSYLDAGQSNGVIREIIPLAQMTAVIAVPKANPKKFTSLADLEAPGVEIASANPDATAIGRLTQRALEASGHWRNLQPRIKVLKPTVNDVANDVKLGTVDAGIVWDATVNQYPELAAVSVPELQGAVAEVGVGVLSFSEQPAAALRFARFLGSREFGLPVFQKSGFVAATGDSWTEQPQVVLYSGGVNRVAIEETLREFEAREGVTVNRVYNGCGILTAQIRSGQRPDAYFACDVSFMTNVASHFLKPVELSQTRMVILTRQGNPKSLRTLADLTQPGLALGIANPQQSALGALTVRLLRAEGLLDQVMPNVRVQTPTADLLVNQLRTGALDAALVYAANTSQVKGILEIIELPQESALATQPYAIGRDSQHPRLMERLLQHLRSPASRARFEQTGFRWRDASPER
ncbi:MAG: molybdate ABC transporter substrate-binding protein [Verrucomicrobiales bacterium]|nr:molybdate ABC transporter substrate-binding protein [Verrucomicrobiales bacterium]